MRFSEESELMFRRQPECTRLGDRFIYGESLLPGDPWDLPENLVRHAIDPRSRRSFSRSSTTFSTACLIAVACRCGCPWI